MSKRVVCDCEVIHKEVVDEVKRNMPPSADFETLSRLYKMFADNTRIKILWALSQKEMCVCDLAVLLNMTKSAISHQLKSLRLTNLVKYTKSAQVVYYSLADEHVLSIFKTAFDHIHE